MQEEKDEQSEIESVDTSSTYGKVWPKTLYVMIKVVDKRGEETPIVLLNYGKLTSKQKSRLWYRRTMFADINNLRRMTREKICGGLEVVETLHDEDFPEKLMAKPRRKPHKKAKGHVKRKGYGLPGHVQHVDTMGPFQHPAIYGARFASICTCECSEVMRPYLQKKKSDWPAAMDKNAKRWSAERQPWRIMRSDNAPDLVQGQAINVADEWDIIFEHTPPRSPASNTLAETSVNKCKNGIASALMVSPHMPTCTLSGALTYFCRVHELLAPTWSDKTRYEIRTGIKPNWQEFCIRVWGCEVICGLTKKERMQGLTQSEWQRAIRGYLYDVRGVSVDVWLPKDWKIITVSRTRVQFIEAPYINPSVEIIKHGENESSEREIVAEVYDSDDEMQARGAATTAERLPEWRPDVEQMERDQEEQRKRKIKRDREMKLRKLTREKEMRRLRQVQLKKKYEDFILDNADENDDTRGKVVDIVWDDTTSEWRAVVEWDNDPNDRTDYPEKDLRGRLHSFKMTRKREREIDRAKETRSKVSKALGIADRDNEENEHQQKKSTHKMTTRSRTQNSVVTAQLTDVPDGVVHRKNEDLDALITTIEETWADEYPLMSTLADPSRPAYAQNPELPPPDLSEDMLAWMRKQTNPKTFIDALMGRDWIGQLHACCNEMKSWNKMAVTEKVLIRDLPSGARLIGGDDVFVRKWFSLKEFNKHKMRHVCWGQHMVAGIDYGDTSAPTASPDSVRIFFSICASQQIAPRAIDIKTAFLNCLQKRKVFLRRAFYESILAMPFNQIQEFREKLLKLPTKQLKKIRRCKWNPRDQYANEMKKLVYGAPDASRGFYLFLYDGMCKASMKMSTSWVCFWYRIDPEVKPDKNVRTAKMSRDSRGRMMETECELMACLMAVTERRLGKQFRGSWQLAITWVDDVPNASNNSAWDRNLVEQLDAHCEDGVTVDEKLEQCLGMRVKVHEDGSIEQTLDMLIHLAYQRYAKYVDLLEEREKYCISPADEGLLLEKTTDEEWAEAQAADIPYPRVVGIINYIMAKVKPQLAVIASMLASHINKYSIQKFKHAIRALVYANNTRNQGILYSPYTTFYGANIVYVYADADLGADESGRARYGGVLMLNGAAVSWKSKLRLVHQDTCSAELCAAAEMAVLSKGVNLGLDEISIGPTESTIQFCDNKSAIEVVLSDEGVRGKTRSYKLSTCKLRELVLLGDIVMTYIMTCRQVGDLFTKILGPQQFCELTDKATGYWTRWVNGQPPKRYRHSTTTSVQVSEDK